MSTVWIGNDVVDLGQPRTQGRFEDARFLDRVLAPAEADAVRSAPEPDLELWCRWAAKEAGFKVISKLLGSPPRFVHRAFETVWQEEARHAWGPGALPHGPEATVRTGTVRYGELHVPVTVARCPGSLHAVAFGPRPPAPLGGVLVHTRVVPLDEPGAHWAATLEELLLRLTPREADAVYSRASGAVRVGARRELAWLLGISESRLEIVCAPGPTSQRMPRVLLDGRATEADVSLSHDGRWIAWALWTDVAGAVDTLRARVGAAFPEAGRGPERRP